MKRREKLKELEQRHKIGNFIRFVTRHYTISTLVLQDDISVYFKSYNHNVFVFSTFYGEIH